MGLNLRPLGKKIWDQINPLDNGRTFKNQTPTNNRSVAQQLTHNGVTNVVGSAVKQANRAATQIYETPVGRAFGPSQSSVIESMARRQPNPVVSTAIRQKGYNDLLNEAGIGINDNPSTVFRKSVSDIGGTAANFIPVGKTAEVVSAGFRPTVRTLTSVANRSGVASATGAGLEVLRDTSDPAQVAKAAAVGYGVGVALPIAGAAAKQLPKVTRKIEDVGYSQSAQGRVNIAEQQVLRDFSDSLVGANKAQGRELSDLITKARVVGQKYGVDLTTGPVRDRLDRANGILDTIGKQRQTFTQSGFIQLPERPKVVKKASAARPPVGKAQVTPPAVTAPATLPKITAESKARGFKKNMFKENFYKGNPTAKQVVEAMPGYKPISNKKTISKAVAEVSKDPRAAYARIATKPQLSSADDVATGNVLLRQAIEGGDVEAAIQIGTKLGIDGTKLGQAVQAYATWKKTTPEGIVRYASKQAGKVGRELDPKVTGELIEQAKRIADMPESLERAKATRELLGQADKLGRDWKTTVGEILNTPRAAMATADFSAPLRQGAVLGSRFPKEFGKNFVESVKYFFKPGAYEQAMYDLSQRPSYALMKSHKLAVDGAEQLSGTEEQFMSNILESDFAKKLGYGHLVAASSRAYTGFLTKLRADAFDKIVADSKAGGVKLDKNSLDSLAKFINSASGRGDGKLTAAVSRLNVLFSPRLWKSRVDTINPGYYARLDPVARKYALQSAGAFFGVMGTVLGLAAMAGAEVEPDPRSADFGKIKIGNTRYDILGGHQQNIRLIAQMVTGEKINSETGELQTLGPDRGFGKPSRLDLLYQFAENKENPVVAFGTKALRQTDAAGNPVNLATEAGKLVVPLTAQGTYDTAVDQGSLAKGAAMNIPGTFGVGVQTYGGGKKPPVKPGTSETKTADGVKKDELQSGAGGGYTVQKLDNGKYGYTLEGDPTVHTSTDLASARKAVARDSFKKSDQKKKVIGDTYFYKTKDGKVRTKPKVQYEFEQKEAKLNLDMDRAYEAGDTKNWLTLADKKYAALESKKSLYDPETEQDEIDKLILQQENLQQRAQGYIEKGIGGKGASKKSAGSAFKYAVSPTAGGGTSRPTITAKRVGRVKSTKGTAKRIARPKVTVKKSLA